MGIGESIKRDHDEYRIFFAKLFKTTSKDAKLREQLFTDFRRKVYAHHIGEEMTILPRMANIPDMKDLALELEVEHSDMKTHFEALIKEGYDREIWRYKLVPLYDIMHAHWLKEEETMIPFGPEYFSKEEWEDFGKRFDEIVDEYLKKH
jgi:hemerythrin superfamily protein